MTSIDKEGVNAACEEVRDDSNETQWVLLGFQDKQIVVNATGTDYNEFLDKLTDDERFFGYARFVSGDEMSKRSKFVFITWIGADVGALKRGKMSTDKSQVKGVITNFAAEILAETKGDLEHSKVMEIVAKAGGANYGTGQR